jgi:predicted DNA-binding protein (MmcQ/YjbR family)
VQEVVERALRFPGAIFIRTPASGFGDPTDVSYEIGLQQPRKHVRFANVFVYGDEAWMYVKHDPTSIAEISRAHPVLPSEIASKTWSKTMLGPGSAATWIFDLLETSHALVAASLTKAGREALAELDRHPNMFSNFHRMARAEQAAREDVFLTYSDVAETPNISVGAECVARFSWNALQTRNPEGTWTTVGPDRVDAWPEALARGLRRR